MRSPSPFLPLPPSYPCLGGDPVAAYVALRQRLGLDQPHFFWAQGSRVLIGVGARRHWHSHGPERFQHLRQLSRSTNGFWLGSFGFSDRDPSYFFNPQVTLHGQGSAWHLTCWDPDLGDPADLWASLPPVKIPWQGSPAALPVQLPAPPLQGALERALGLIHQGSLEKIVLAAPYEMDWHPSPEVGVIVQGLRQMYPDCTVFACQHPQGGIFLGASPETLVRLEQGRLFTIALAGSRPRHRDPDQDWRLGQGLLESTKDRYEQHLVTESIVSALHSLGISPQLPDHYPTLRQLCHIQHLQTPIHARMPDHLHLVDLVAALHPTAAVAGLPRERACAYLPYLESFQRGF
ncbi:MAG: chorismate-binding protein, partial [Thermostichales cyanobacterium BF4_bins_65]